MFSRLVIYITRVLQVSEVEILVTAKPSPSSRQQMTLKKKLGRNFVNFVSIADYPWTILETKS